MATDRSGKELTWTFLMDAWEALAALEEGVKGISSGEGAAAARQIVIVSHRLKGTAALFGFQLISDVASAVERAIEAAGSDPGSLADSVPFLRDTAAIVQESLDAIALGSGESAPLFAAFRLQHGRFFPAEAESSLRDAPPFLAAETPLPSPTQETPGPEPSGITGELDRFFRGNPDASFFVPEAEEHLDTALAALGKEHKDEDPSAATKNLFRAFHTLKGAAFTVGCTPIGTLSHRVEDLLALVRSGRLPLAGAVESVIHRAVEALREMLPGRASDPGRIETAYAGVIASIDEVVSATAPGGVEEVPPSKPAPALAPAEAAPAGAPAPRPAAAAPFGATIRVHLNRLEGLLNLASDLMIVRGRLERHVRDLEDAGTDMAHGRRRLATTIGEFSAKHLNPQLNSPENPAELSGTQVVADRQGLAGFSDLEFERYDDFNILARSIGELDDDLAQAQSQVHALLSTVRGEMESLGTIVKDLRNSVSRVRLVAIGQLFSRSRRYVQQHERETGRNVLLETRGEGVEIDNLILEKIADPLLHLVRNALVHGIEPADDRIKAGKDPVGHIRLEAYSRGNKVWIEVGDDGLGMDPEALSRRAVALGMISEEGAKGLTAREAVDLIFLPGFSTMTSLTTDAGRGVGLDIVRTNVQRLKGEIEVSSKPGEGTTFILKVPLTLIVSQALLVEVGARKLAFSISAVETLLPVTAADIHQAGDREFILHNNEKIPVLRLRALLGLDGGEAPEELVAVLLNAGGKRVFALVDQALGSEDVVLKSLGAFLETLSHLQGAAISSSGELILVLDPAGLLELRSAAPAHAVPAARPAFQARPSAPREAGSGILLVDDSVSVRKVVSRMLEGAGFLVDTANDGEEALDRLRDGSYSVIITDLEMPRLNGYELIQQLRQRPAWKDVPILVLTTRVGESHVKLAQELGANGFLSKPVVQEKLVAVVRRVCLAENPAGAA